MLNHILCLEGKLKQCEEQASIGNLTLRRKAEGRAASVGYLAES